jgi:hypothetical protein
MSSAVVRNLDNLGHDVHDRCSVPDSLRLHHRFRTSDVLRPLQQAFCVSMQLAATVESVHLLGSRNGLTLHHTVQCELYKHLSNFVQGRCQNFSLSQELQGEELA